MKKIITVNEYDPKGNGSDIYHFVEIDNSKEHKVVILQSVRYKKRSQTGKMYEESYDYHHSYNNTIAPVLPNNNIIEIIGIATFFLGVMWEDKTVYWKDRNGIFRPI